MFDLNYSELYILYLKTKPHNVTKMFDSDLPIKLWFKSSWISFYNMLGIYQT